MNRKDLNIALITDFFLECGGAERVAIILANNLDADLYTTVFNWELFKKEIKIKKSKVKEIGLIFKDIKRTNLLTYSEAAIRYLTYTLSKDYNIYLFFGHHCIAAASRYHPNIWFCNSPLRIITDLHKAIFKRLPYLQKPIFKMWCKLYKPIYFKWIKNCDKILANSVNVSKKIKKYYKRNAIVVRHPVETKKFYCKSFEDFYFVPGRLTKEKRIDLIIRAFKEMPDKKLIISGDGGERKNLERLASGCENIIFTGVVNFSNLVKFYSQCTAVIYIPIQEPYGLVPIEAAASGKPCITVNEGGCKETVINGRTGYLIRPNVKEIKKYVRYLTPERAEKMSAACLTHAKKFDVEIFMKNVKKQINEVLRRW